LAGDVQPQNVARQRGFPGLAALALAREICPGIPFLFVSGAIGDEVAVESLKAGEKAFDFNAPPK